MDPNLKQELLTALGKAEMLCNFMINHGFKAIDILSGYSERPSEHHDICELGIEFEQLAEELQEQ